LKIKSSLGSLVHGKVVNSNGTVDKKFENHWIFRLCLYGQLLESRHG
jgi:hypothetical protein